MAEAWESIKETYKYVMDDLSHPISRNWFLIPSPVPLLVILVIYCIFCTKLGPWLMKNRKPFELKTVIKWYNMAQVIISLYITYEGFIYIFSGNFNFRCQGVGKGEIRSARAIHAYFLTKLIELLDTIFFVLRKSERQISFLHLYHHTFMPIASWFTVKYIPGGQSVLLGSINSFIHIVMYSYYLLSSLGPQYQKYLWWKNYLTVLQIVQFLVALVHSVNSLRYSCDFHVIYKLIVILEACIFIYMFSMFYYRNYIVKGDKSTRNSNGHSVNGSSKVIKNGSATIVTNGKSNSVTVTNGCAVNNGKNKQI